MPRHDAHARAVACVAPPPIETDPDIVGGFLEDAAHYPDGRAAGLVRPRSVDEVAAVLSEGHRVLAVGARSSLTGGATPRGDLVLSTERLTGIVLSGDRVRVGAGVSLAALQAVLASAGQFFPPVPTYLGATVGGAVSTNAAGAGTFKYGPIRPWVDRLTVVLAGGDVLAIERGAATASPEGRFEIHTARGPVVVPVPAIRMPDVPKRSAGYHAEPGMDLIDLFIGSEGTLGVVTDVTLRVATPVPVVCWALVPVPTEPRAVALVDALRDEARRTWASGDSRGLDIAAIEHLDRRSLEIVREDGVDRRLNLTLPDDASVVLLVQIELPGERPAAELWGDLASAGATDAPDTPLGRFCRVRAGHAVLETTEIALPDHARRARQFVELREAVPLGVAQRVARAQATIDPRISKTAADMIVPVDRFGEMMRECRRLFAEHELDLAVWGHISDGNVHPNVIPRSMADVERGYDAIFALGRFVIGVGGCPLAEHGVGRNPVKQALLRELYGDDGVAAMRRVKACLDPRGQLAPGVLFPATDPS